MKKKQITIEDLAGMMQRGFLEIRKDMVTKEDLKRMVTKEDLKRMVTKEDLKRMATKEDLAEVKADIALLKEDVALIKMDISDIRRELKGILIALDKAGKDYADYLEEKVMRDAEIARIKKWVEQIAKETGVELKD